MPRIDWAVVTGALVLLIIAYWYADRKKHPRRSAWSAFLVFVSVFGGLALAGVVLAAGALYALDLDEAAEATAVTVIVPILFFAVIAPAFMYARHLIQRPPSRQPQPLKGRDGGR